TRAEEVVVSALETATNGGKSSAIPSPPGALMSPCFACSGKGEVARPKTGRISFERKAVGSQERDLRNLKKKLKENEEKFLASCDPQLVTAFRNQQKHPP